MVTVLNLPTFLEIPKFPSISVGLIFLVSGFFILMSTFKCLKVSRAFGKEIYGARKESKLITTGIYSQTRNPLYLGSTIMFFGWFLITSATFLFIMTLFFTTLFYFVAKWEEKELIKRFGKEYEIYRKSVPSFIPRIRTLRRE